MKRYIIIVVLIGLVLFSVQATASDLSKEEFFTELAFQLSTRGWDDDEITPLIENARLLQWDEATRADPAIVAFALHFGAHESPDSSNDTATIRAHLALQLAIETTHMESLGYKVQEAAQQAARGAKEVMEQIRSQPMQAKGEPVGLLVRNMVKQEVHKEVPATQQRGNSTNAPGAGSSFPMNFNPNNSIGIGNRPDHAQGPQR